MRESSPPQILANIPRDQFVGRTMELDTLTKFARGKEGSVISVLKAPGSGATELLLQTFDQTFRESGDVIPVYFAFSPGEDVKAAAERFQRESAAQIVAFQQNDPTIIGSAAEAVDLPELAPAADREWITRLVRPTPSFRALFARLSDIHLGFRILVILDDIENIAFMPGGRQVVAELINTLDRRGALYLIAGARRFLFAKLPGRSITLARPSVAECSRAAEAMSERYGVPSNEQTRDLLSVQLNGDLSDMSRLFRGAAEQDERFENFSAVQSSYAEEIFGGRISLGLENKIDHLVAGTVKRTLLELIRTCMEGPGGSSTLSAWRNALQLESREFRRLMERLHVSELVNCSPTVVNIERENHVLQDYVLGDARIALGAPRALVFGESLSFFIKRGPQLLGRYYRRSAALPLKELLRTFDGQQVPFPLLDYRKFKHEAKGLPSAEAYDVVENSSDRKFLPHIVFAADTSAFYPKLAELIEDERSAVALGFEEDNGRDDTVWIAAEIDSKLEADEKLAEFWCDRLEMAAANCGFDKYTLWIVAPEGFSDTALDVLESRNAIGSSRLQVEMLQKKIFVEDGGQARNPVDSYELVIPMGADTEIIAAGTLEDIARKHAIPSKTINQMKTALVEACINASEHSLSPDRRIYQRFEITDERAVITITNRGIRLLDRLKMHEQSPEEGRRGWGLKLMRSLMDEVSIEGSDDGTRITMVKYLQLPG